MIHKVSVEEKRKREEIEGRRGVSKQREDVHASPLVRRRYEDGGALHYPSFDVARLLFVHHQKVVGIQLDGIPNLNEFHLQTVEEHLTGAGGERERQRGGGTKYFLLPNPGTGHHNHCLHRRQI